MKKDTLPFAVIAERYGFESLKLVKLAGGLSAENYFAIANNISPVVIKRHKAKTEQAVKQTEVVLASLAAASIPAPRPLKTPKGEQPIIFNNDPLSIYPVQGQIK